jgi:hypothetical protein
MGSINNNEAGEAVSSMQALQSALTEELEDIERRINALGEDEFPLSRSEADNEVKLCYVARAALFSALASINEVLGWVHLMVEKDSEGNVTEVVRSLPTVPMFSIH